MMADQASSRRSPRLHQHRAPSAWCLNRHACQDHERDGYHHGPSRGEGNNREGGHDELGESHQQPEKCHRHSPGEDHGPVLLHKTSIDVVPHTRTQTQPLRRAETRAGTSVSVA